MAERKIHWPVLGDVLRAAKERKETWLWDGLVPLGDITLLAAFMKKGKTTLLSGLVNGVLRKGSYCGRGTHPVKKVLYLSAEEGDTVAARFANLGFEAQDSPFLTLVTRNLPVWKELVQSYSFREWESVVSELKGGGYELVVLDGLNTMLQMFEPNEKEDNEGVGKFMSRFVLPLGTGFTVVASLHTKKRGGDPKIHVPPEEMVRGASAWLAHPGQILVMDSPKPDVKRFCAFGRYQGTRVDDYLIGYDERIHDYREVTSAEEKDLESLREQAERSTAESAVLLAVRQGAQTIQEIQAKTQRREADVRACLKALESTGMLAPGPKRVKMKTWILGGGFPGLGGDSPEDVEG